EEGEDIPLDKMEELYADEHEEDLNDIEEAEEDSTEEDIGNTTQCMSKAELTLMLCSGDNKEILDQTLPIVEEHVRKWKEAGLDRILNTFDAQKIEQHVGDWLRRHNSAYGDKSLQQQVSPLKPSQKRHKQNVAHDPFPARDSNDSETESMHSVDTARYIRESRKCTVSTTSKCSSPMTTIKTYRTVPRKRAELRAKYACDEFSEEQEHHHMQALLHRRDQLHRRNREHERHLRYHPTTRHYPYGHELSLNGPHRRKHLRKRRDASLLYSSSSSSEDDRMHSRCECSPCLRRSISQTVHPYYSYRSYSHSHSHGHGHSHSHSYRDYHHQRLESNSRSTHSMLNFKRSVCKLRRQHAFEEDMRPRMLESECNCCNNDRLCSNVVHIANSSTEEWYVENKSSPDPQLETPKTHPTPVPKTRCKTQSNLKEKIQDTQRCIDRQKSVALSEEDESQEEEEQAVKKIASNKKKVSESGKKASQALVKFTGVENASSKSTARKQKATSKAKDVEPITTTDCPPKAAASSVTRLPTVREEPVLAPSSDEVVVAKATVDKNKPPTATAKEKIGSKKRNAETKKTTAKNPISKAKQKKKAAVQSEESEDELQKVLELSKKTFLEEQEKSRQRQNMSKVSDEASTSLQLPEKSTFSNCSVACNSTVVSNKNMSSVRSGNTTLKAPPVVAQIDLNSSDESCGSSKTLKGMQSERDADCTMVTSTTGCEAAAAPAEEPVAVPRPQFTLTKKGILLYAPPQPIAAGDQTQSINSSQANFTLTEHSLSPIIGQRRARKYLKHHIGSRSFDSRYSVYYRPTPKIASFLSADDKSVDLDSSSSSGSDADIFEQIHRYGIVYTVLEKVNEGD
ncbi:hypothetical protein KR222_002133, partial [Zaprionus bogoriensis]